MNPSLLLIPDRYKAAKLYSQIPDSGAGDLTFARNSNATRVNSEGLIEKVRTNVITFSEQFDNAAWDKSNCTISSNVITAPDGTSTADKLILNNGQSGSSGDGTGLRQLVDIASNNYTLSIFAKAGEFSTIRFRENQVTGAFLTINLLNGAITNGDSNQFINPKTELYANGWYRISFQTPTLTAIYKYSIRVSETGNGTSGIYIWGAQLETGDIATPYIPTTTAAVSVGITADIPRLDYTGGGCPSLLLEPQRTNSLQYSEQIDNAYWTKLNLTITANQLVSPDGSTNADLVTLSAGTSTKQFFSTAFTAITAAYSYSIFAKKGTHNFIQLLEGPTITINFDLNLGTFNSVSGASGKIENYGNGWYRCTMFGTGAVTPVTIVNVIAVDSLTAARAQTTSSTGTFYAWGAQVEAGSYPTSYIPTLGSSVTRLADVASKTGISSLIGQASGTIYTEVTFGDNPTGMFFLSLVGSVWTSDAIYIEKNGSGFIQISSVQGGVGVGSTASTILAAPKTKAKIAGQYSGGTFNLYVNGIKFSGTRTANALCSGLYFNQIGTLSDSGNFQENLFGSVALFTTALSDAECIALTTL